MDTNSHIRGPIQLARFLDGTNPRVPRTVAQMYKEVVDQFVGTDVQKEMVSKVNSLWEETMSNRVMLHSIYRQIFLSDNSRTN